MENNGNNSPNLNTEYINSLLQPRPVEQDRRVWSIPLQGVWLPFLIASNTTGQSNIPPEVLGAPVRLAKDKDGSPKFSKSGRPVLRTVKELSDQVCIVRDNFTFGLVSFANAVQKAMPDQYKEQVEAAMRAAEPLIKADTNCLTQYLETLKAAEAPPAPTAEAPVAPPVEPPATPPAETPTPKPKRKGKPVATVIAQAEAAAATEANKELVPV